MVKFPVAPRFAKMLILSQKIFSKLKIKTQKKIPNQKFEILITTKCGHVQSAIRFNKIYESDIKLVENEL
jgi:hypothetical protein